MEMAKKYVEKLKGMKGMRDSEAAHSIADEVLLSALREAGLGEVADAWEELEKDEGFGYV